MSSMTDWPTSRPGYPMHAERDGWHWIATLPNIVPTPWRWWPDSESDGGGDWRAPGSRWATPLRNMQRYHYLGPCYTQADLDAAVQAERAACAGLADSQRQEYKADGFPHEALALAYARDTIRSRGPTPALDAALAQARRETWEKAAEIAERVAIPEDCHGVEAHGRLMAAHAAADAIRSAAAGEERK